MTSLATSAKNILRPFKRKVESLIPKRLSVKPAIVQAYLGGECESRYTLVNFPSLYSPSKACPCIYDVALYGPSGNCIGERSLTIEPFGSFEVRPGELFGINLPEFGMFTAKIRPANPWSDKHLGQIASHFYALYEDKAHKSFALVHPQTFVNAPCGGQVEWVSGYLMDCSKIRKVTAIQINPTDQFAETTLYLFRDGEVGNHISEMKGMIPPMGARKVEWNLTEAGFTEGLFSIAAIGLPTDNAKPILLTHFEDGSFSGMHG